MEKIDLRDRSDLIPPRDRLFDRLFGTKRDRSLVFNAEQTELEPPGLALWSGLELSLPIDGVGILAHLESALQRWQCGLKCSLHLQLAAAFQLLLDAPILFAQAPPLGPLRYRRSRFPHRFDDDPIFPTRQMGRCLPCALFALGAFCRSFKWEHRSAQCLMRANFKFFAAKASDIWPNFRCSCYTSCLMHQLAISALSCAFSGKKRDLD